LAGVSNCGAAAGAALASSSDAAVAETTVREMELDGMELVSFPDSGEANCLSPRNRVRQNSNRDRVEI
jgi:hypothetical protein